MPKHVRKEHEGPTIDYPDAQGLVRPQTLPKTQIAILGVFVLAALIIGGVILYNTLDKMYFSADRKHATVQEVIANDAKLDLPYLPATITQSDDDVRSWMTGSGFVTQEMDTDSAGNVLGFDVIKLPTGVTLLEAQLAYAQGLSSVDADEAARLLHGSWRLTIERTGSTTMTVRYADFTSGSLDLAIKNAMDLEGLTGSVLGESGVDSMGNTFQAGTVVSGVDNNTYHWQVSAIALSDVYKINGLPENSVYVGVRISQ